MITVRYISDPLCTAYLFHVVVSYNSVHCSTSLEFLIFVLHCCQSVCKMTMSQLIKVLSSETTSNLFQFFEGSCKNRFVTQNNNVWQCLSTDRPRSGTGPWHQLCRAARGSPGICHFSFLRTFHE